MSVQTLALAISLAAAWPARAPQLLSVVSPNGRFSAEATPRSEPRDPKTGDVHCDLAVYELRGGAERVPQWMGLYDFRGHPAGHFLSDDGSAFVHVDDRALADRAIVRVIERGLPLAAFDANALHVAARTSAPTPRVEARSAASGAAPNQARSGEIDRAEPWIDLTPASCRLRDVVNVTNTSRYLDLLGRDGILRTIDLATGALELGAELVPETRPRLDRALSSEAQKDLEAPFVQSISMPALAFDGEPVAVEITGSFPSAGWELQGFDLAADARAPDRFVITPLARPPSGAAAQVMRPFRATAKLLDLHFGTYVIGVHGHEYARPVADATVEIAPRSLVVMTNWGSAASPRTIALVADGRCIDLFDRSARPRSVLAPLAAVREIEQRVRDLDPALAKTAPGAEHVNATRELVWIAGSSLVRVVRDESALEPPLRALTVKLEELARPAPVRYAIDAQQSRLEVHTSSAGLFSAFGHDHTIAARGIEGFIEARPDDLDHASVELTARADSLEVVDRASQSDRAAIEKEMRDGVLESTSHPLIRFKSTSISTRPLGPRTRDVTLAGELDLHGRRRAITLQGRIGIDEDEIEARGELELRQSDFGIRPTSAAGGTIKVDDVVKIEFDLRARPQR